MTPRASSICKFPWSQLVVSTSSRTAILVSINIYYETLREILGDVQQFNEALNHESLQLYSLVQPASDAPASERS
ncbi:hypothetical protein [Aureliella helgolandensis]|uniref:hypothetical protein n=1 Tax=Aureliella helgolandensis TaxID=2527968 RepID=UPI0011A6B2A0|nr:hypothetical protein [Aureliella helgolandensis]